jgi:hypothetical protein
MSESEKQKEEKKTKSRKKRSVEASVKPEIPFDFFSSILSFLFLI